MSRHRNVRRLYSDDYNDYHDLVPSSLEEDSLISPGTVLQYMKETSESLNGTDFILPTSNQSLNITASEFPEEDTCRDSGPTHQNIQESVGAITNEFDKLVVGNVDGLCEGAFDIKSSTFQPFEFDADSNDFAELDFSCLTRSLETFKSAIATKPTRQPTSTIFIPSMEEKGAIRAESNKKNTCQKISSLGLALKQDCSLTSNYDFKFLSLMIEIRRPRTCAFLCHLGVSEPFHVFRFDTPQPIYYDSTPDCKISTNTLPKVRNKHPQSQHIQRVPKDIERKIQPELPPPDTSNVGTRLPKATNEARLPPQLNKPIDRSCLLQAYDKKNSSGKEKDLINLLVVGHVDAGKSTLMGNVLCQVGQVSEKQLAKYQWEAQKIGKASFAYAWVLDQTSEERSRGITMDIAQMAFETQTKKVVLLDAPGHRDFVPQVIGGAAQADVALLVVNATSGEFETGMQLVGGQTQEHARLVRLLGVSRLIVAVNKMDTVAWSQSRFEDIRATMVGMLKTINQADVVFCPVSGLYGINLIHSTDTPPERDIRRLAPWYDGPCLLDIIDSLDKVERSVDGPFRFVVSDIFKPIGSSVPIVAGRVVSGAVSAGVNLPTSKIICLPSGQSGSIRSIRSLASVSNDGSGSGTGVLDVAQPYAFAGDQVGLMLSGLDANFALTPGDVICDPDPPLVPVTTHLRARVLIFDVKQPITKGYPVIFYYHCSSVSATITKLLSATVKKKGSDKKDVVKPRCLFGRCTAEIELKLDSPVCMEVYDVCKPLGRFVLRVGGESIAGGTVIALKRKSVSSGVTQSEIK